MARFNDKNRRPSHLKQQRPTYGDFQAAINKRIIDIPQLPTKRDEDRNMVDGSTRQVGVGLLNAGRGVRS